MAEAQVPVVLHVAQLRQQIAAWKRAGESIAFVPTMGSLHAGHLSLVQAARARAQRVLVSIFVNPLQFVAGEDFAAYPRSLQEDCKKLAPLGVDLVFAPQDAELYPRGRQGLTQVVVPGLSAQFCGAYRDGHFQGVTTVVALLFNLVQPDLAVFGEKDFQQLVIIRRMVEDLHFPVEILGMPTCREASGLAMSSRNAFLSEAEKAQAASIYAQLRAVAAALRAGERAFAGLQQAAEKALKEAGLQPQFFEIRALDLSPPDDATQQFVILAAAKLGSTRLIDNLTVDLAELEADSSQG